MVPCPQFFNEHLDLMLQNIFKRSFPQVVKQICEQSESYEEWLATARSYDEEYGLEEWKHIESSEIYDNQEIRLRLDKLRSFRKKGDNHGLLFTLNEGIHGNMGGIGNPKLYNKALSGTKRLIEEYVDEVADAIEHIAHLDHTEITFEEKIDFFRRASQCFGRTALMLSGGGQLGHFHMGVLKAMIENNLLPNVISGSSAGSIFTAFGGHLHIGRIKTLFRTVTSYGRSAKRKRTARPLI